jgi:long-chain acyl-CoA synthetase
MTGAGRQHAQAEPTLSSPLRRAIQLASSREAVVDGGMRMNYGQLFERTRGLSGGLRQIGLRSGDIVAGLAFNSFRHLEMWLGLPAAHLVVNDLNIRLSIDELQFILDDSGARMLVTDRFHADTARQLQARCPAITALVWADDSDPPDGMLHWDELCAAEPLPLDHAELQGIDADTLAAISYTGGTTGRPKGVMQSHGNLIANAKHILLQNPLHAADRFLHTTPMFHAAGVANVYALTWVGGTHVVAPRFEPDLWGQLMEAERATVTVLVPTMINTLLQYPGTARRDLGNWRLLIYASSPMPVDLLKRALAAFPCEFAQVYGMTEASPHVAGSNGDDHRRAASGRPEDEARLLSCGTAAIGVDVEIRAGDGRPCAAGEIGEVVVRGPNVMLGYWNRQQETADAFTNDGWYRSGDLAYADADGYLYIVDRIKDMVITGGENVYTSEVENALCMIGGVVEVAAFGIPDPIWVEAVHAEVVVAAGSTLDEQALIAGCRQHIAGFKVPRSINVRYDPLPKSGAGKILKRQLRQPFWDTPTPPST